MFFSRSLFNISLNILSRLSSLLSHPPLLHTLPKTLNISQRRNAKALQTIASIILLGKTSELYIQSNDYTGFHCIRVCTYNFINGITTPFPITLFPKQFPPSYKGLKLVVLTRYLPGICRYIFIFTPTRVLLKYTYTFHYLSIPLSHFLPPLYPPQHWPNNP